MTTMTTMTTRFGSAVAIAFAVVSLILVSSWASAHQDHEESAREATMQPVIVEPLAESTSSPANLHDHANHAGKANGATADVPPDRPKSNLPEPLAWFGRFHPPLTHFPIALLTVAAVGELLLMRTRAVYFDHAVHFSVWFGSIGALGAATLGWLFAGFRLVDDEWPMTAHRWAGTATALLAAILLVLLQRASRGTASRRTFRTALFSGAALVGATGFLGGALLYGLDHYSWSVTQ